MSCEMTGGTLALDCLFWRKEVHKQDLEENSVAHEKLKRVPIY